MRAGKMFIAGAGMLLIVAGAAGCDLLLNGNEDAINGVIGASLAAIVAAVVGSIVGHFDDEDERGE